MASRSPRTVFLVPRRRDHGHRDRLWEWCRARWERLFPDVAIYEGHHEEGLFNRAAAINHAARLADEDGRWQLAIVIDSDVLLKRTQVRRAIGTARRTGRVTWAHRRWRGINEDWTARILADRWDLGNELDATDMDVLVERTNPISWSCCFVVPREVFDDVGGFDERFQGWGFEDLAWQSLVCGLYGWERIEGDVIHLWHPRSEERIVKGQPAITASPEYVANGRLGRRYMYALRRDHGLTDRPTPSSTEELQRDMSNLRRDDEKFALMQPVAERSTWDGWWPSLIELRDGAKAYRVERSKPKVTLIVHTGGAPENWPERSSYLRKSLASLKANVTGPVIQRVVYADWDREFREDLVAIANEFGFYVAGEGRHGFTGSMRRMWSYLGKRALGQYIFRVEDDFLYERHVDLETMIAVLDASPHLAQMALLRGAYYPREFEEGGVLGWPAESFEQVGRNGTRWLEHRNFWTNNPALFRRSLVARDWPSGPSSERLFGDGLAEDPLVRFGLWGTGEAWIRHIGEVKAAARATY